MKPVPPLRLDQIHFYNPLADTRRIRRDLPHWEQDGICAFVTFRMADALPASVLQGWVAERHAWLVENGINPTDKHWRKALEELPEETVTAFHRNFTRRLHELRDAGHGECLLRRADLRRIVEDSFLHWHGERCLLAGWHAQSRSCPRATLAWSRTARPLRIMETLDGPPHQRGSRTPRTLLAG